MIDNTKFILLQEYKTYSMIIMTMHDEPDENMYMLPAE